MRGGAGSSRRLGGCEHGWGMQVCWHQVGIIRFGSEAVSSPETLLSRKIPVLLLGMALCEWVVWLQLGLLGRRTPPKDEILAQHGWRYRLAPLLERGSWRPVTEASEWASKASTRVAKAAGVWGDLRSFGVWHIRSAGRRRGDVWHRRFTNVPGWRRCRGGGLISLLGRQIRICLEQWHVRLPNGAWSAGR